MNNLAATFLGADLSGCGSENLKVCKSLTELYSANSEWWESRRFLKHLPFFLTGVPKAQIVRTRRIGPIQALSCESERGDGLVRDSFVGIDKTAHPLRETN